MRSGDRQVRGYIPFLVADCKAPSRPDAAACQLEDDGVSGDAGGIGFTVSLFIANLSFAGMGVHGADLLNHAKLGIVVGSLVSGILGYLLLGRTLPAGGQYVASDDEDALHM